MITANPLDGPRKPGSVGLPAGAEVRVAALAGSRYVPCQAFTVGRSCRSGAGA